MNGFKIFLLIFLFIKVSSAIENFFSRSDENENVTRFIGDLVRDGKMKDSSRVHDIAILRWESEGKSSLFDEIVQKVQFENILILPSSAHTFKHQRIRHASFVIIMSDVTDAVSHSSHSIIILKYLFSETPHRSL